MHKVMADKEKTSLKGKYRHHLVFPPFYGAYADYIGSFQAVFLFHAFDFRVGRTSVELAST